MKPRLRRASPLTTEDERIFCRLGTEVFFSGALSHAHFMHSMESDRRDAYLMWWAQSNRDCGTYGTSIVNAVPVRYDEWLVSNPLWGKV